MPLYFIKHVLLRGANASFNEIHKVNITFFFKCNILWKIPMKSPSVTVVIKVTLIRLYEN